MSLRVVEGGQTSAPILISRRRKVLAVLEVFDGAYFRWEHVSAFVAEKETALVNFCYVIVSLTLISVRVCAKVALKISLLFWSRIHFNVFLDAFLHLYKRVCPSVGPSVRPSVRPSVGHTRVETMQKCCFWPKLLSVQAWTHLMPCIRPCFILICKTIEMLKKEGNISELEEIYSN